MNPIASDLNNPDFAGATNPDSALIVQFHREAMKNDFRSGEEGRPIFEDVDFIRIFTPGNNLNIVDTPVREDHKQRFPIQWAHYQNQKNGVGKETGTPIGELPRVTKAQAEELRALKFYTVESIANCSDQFIDRLGMIVGMQPFAFRDYCIRYLQLSKDTAEASKTAEMAKATEERARALEAENVSMKEQLEAIKAQVAELAAKKKPGPKPKLVA